MPLLVKGESRALSISWKRSVRGTSIAADAVFPPLNPGLSFGNLSSAAWKDGLDFLNPIMREQGDLSLHASFLKSLGSAKAVQEGKLMHHIIAEMDLDRGSFIGSHLVLMYGTSGNLDDAFEVFDKMHERSMFTWNFLIRACAKHGSCEKVLVLLNQMQQQGVIPTKVTFVSLFDACADLTTIDVGHRMHAMIVNTLPEVDVVVATALVNMYGKLGMIEISKCCFDKIKDRDVIAWTSLISAFSLSDQGHEAIHTFHQMLQEGSIPNEVSFISLCNACCDRDSLTIGKRLHVHISNHGLNVNLALSNALITMYGKCGCLSGAKFVLNGMDSHNLLTWTSIISAFSEHGHHKEAIQLSFHLQQIGILPDNILFSTMVASCNSLNLLSLCKQIHSIILIRETLIDVLIGTILVNAYGKCRNVECAKLIFSEIAEKNIFSWNAMISACSQNGFNKDVYYFFKQMQEEAIFPNKFTFLSILNVCANDKSALRWGLHIHACILQPEIEIENALIDMYGKNNRIDVAESIFDGMGKRDTITWNVMITAYTQYGEMSKAFLYFYEMWQDVVQPDEATFVNILSACVDEAVLVKGQTIHSLVLESGFERDVMVATAIVSMYGRCKNVHCARSVFQQMAVRNEASWNAIITIYEQLDQWEDVIYMFDLMQHDNVLPDYITLITVLSACTNKFSITEGKILHSYVIESGYNKDVVLSTAILNMYGKSGSLDDAQRMFQKMHERSLVSWNTMIAVYAQHGSVVEAFVVFDEMQALGIVPNSITFINMFGACSHSGFLLEAYHFFHVMMGMFLIYPAVDHFICFIDLLGRTGCLYEASVTADNMPVQPSAVSFMALLGACRYRDDVVRGELASKHVSELEPDHYASHLMLSSMYYAAERTIDTDVLVVWHL